MWEAEDGRWRCCPEEYFSRGGSRECGQRHGCADRARECFEGRSRCGYRMGEQTVRGEVVESVRGLGRDTVEREVVSCGEGSDGPEEVRRPGPKWDEMGAGWVGLEAAVEGEGRYTQD